jgi:hypothetical protein
MLILSLHSPWQIEENHKKLSQDNGHPGIDSTQVPPGYMFRRLLEHRIICLKMYKYNYD